MVGRCDDCSFNADTSLFGNYLNVGNCNCGDQPPAYNYQTKTMDYPVDCRCDVAINNRKVRYECSQVADITDCVDYLTYCKTDTFSDQLTDQTKSFCDAMSQYDSDYKKIGDDRQYIDGGNIIWNLQYQASRCGSARTNVYDKYGDVFATDQAPQCLPYSNNMFSNDFSSVEDVTSNKCLSGKPLMYTKVCTDEFCDTNSTTGGCCISSTNCEGTTEGCGPYRAKGVEICEEGSNLKPCENPCATIIDIPNSGGTWGEDICNYFCPKYSHQILWFGDSTDEITYTGGGVSGIGNVEDRICSEEYYMLCTLAGCPVADSCMKEWGENSGIASSRRSWSKLHPTVFLG